jgi:hypothetical protein
MPPHLACILLDTFADKALGIRAKYMKTLEQTAHFDLAYK